MNRHVQMIEEAVRRNCAAAQEVNVRADTIAHNLGKHGFNGIQETDFLDDLNVNTSAERRHGKERRAVSDVPTQPSYMSLLEWLKALLR